jgi:uncharacterized membrane protein YedE/YeeE
MTSSVDPVTLSRIVVYGALVIGLVLGAVGQSTRFCVRGAVADWVEFRSPGRMVAWLLAIAVGAIAAQGLISFGLLDGTRVLAWNNRLVFASCLVGGLLFGFGMILAEGCPQRLLVKAGAGSLRAAAALVVIAIASAMTLRGILAGPRVTLLDSWNVTLAGPQDLGALLAGVAGGSPQFLRWLVVLAVVVAVGVVAWRFRAQVAKADWIGGVAVGLLLAAALVLTGKVGFIAEHPETLEAAWLGTQSKRPEGLTFSAPLAHALDLLTLWSDKSMVATFGVMLALGVLVGSASSARWRGEFKLESFKAPGEMGAHALGALLMGFGGVTALGCSVGNGVTGLAMLSSGALLAVAGMVGGAWVALRMRMRQGQMAGKPAGAATAA